MNEDALVFKRICDRATRIELDGSFVFVRHPLLAEQAEYQEIYEDYFNRHVGEGSPTNEEADQMVRDSGAWTEEDDKEIAAYEDHIERLRIELKTVKIPSKKIGITRQINATKENLSKKQAQKFSLRPLTAEMAANLKVNDQIVVNSFFVDKALKERLFSDEDYQEMAREKIDRLCDMYSKAMGLVDEKKVQKLCLSDFFSPMFSIYSTPTDFFGAPIVNLTRPQITMSTYCNIFKKIFENIPKIPANICKDPEALLEFAENYSAESSESSTKARNSDISHRSVVGATREDLETMRRDGESIVDLGELAKKVIKEGEGSVRLIDIMNYQIGNG